MPILYTDTVRFEDATVLCTDAQLTQHASTGYYSINGKWRHWYFYSHPGKFTGRTFICTR